MEQTASQVADTVAQVKEQVGSAFTNQRDWAIAELNGLAEALREAASNLERQAGTGGDGAAMPAIYPVVEELADRIGASANFLQGKEMRQLLDDAESLAKRQPMMFAGALLGIGVIGARLLKGSPGASSDRSTAGSSSQGRSWPSGRSSVPPNGNSSTSNSSQFSMETTAGQTAGAQFNAEPGGEMGVPS